MNCIETPQSRCRVGVAQADITPPVGIYHRMWGAAVHDRSTGIHRPLTATALVLQSQSISTDFQVFVSIDHCLFWTQEMNRLLDSVSAETAIRRDSIMILFSHTHGAGLMGLERANLPGGELIEPYLEELARTISHLIIEARDQLKEATIVYGNGQCDLAQHRDFYDETRGHYVCGFNPSGTADDRVVVGRATDLSGQPICTIVNYACHPTTLAWDNTLISPDYVGALREVVEGATGVPMLFVQGASGDIGPREGFVGDVAVADRNGRQLGYAVLSAFEALPPPGRQFHYTGPVVSGATIGTWQYREELEDRKIRATKWVTDRSLVPLKYRNDLPSRSQLEQDHRRLVEEEQQAISQNDLERSRKLRALIERSVRYLTRIQFLPEGNAYPYPIDVWRIGDAVWVALDGEHYNVLQRVLRDRFPGLPLVIGTIANGSKTWYLLEQSSYGLGLYQEEVAVLERGCLERVIDSTSDAIRRVLNSN